jgi:hypothetical protein
MAKTRILVVEDEGIISWDMENTLNRMGYEVAGAVDSGEEAIQKAVETKPDLVLMDIVLKGEMDGVEAAKQIRDRLDIPVIYLTSYADEQTLQRAKITEPFGYLLKPFEEKELHSTIEVALYRHEMEQKSKERERWFATTLRSIKDGMITTDQHGFLTFMNPVAETLTGWRQEEAVGRPLTEVFLISSERTGTPVQDSMNRVLEEGMAVALIPEAVLVAKEGTKWSIETSWAPIKGDRGAPIGSVLVFHDIRERKQSEKEMRELQEQLRQSQKMEAIGRLAGGIAHDFNNALTIIKVCSQLSLLELKEGDPLREKVQIIHDATQRSADLSRQLLAFSRRQVMEMKVLDLNLILRDLEKMLQRIIGEDIELNILLAEDLGRVKADRGQIDQVVINLAVNARHAMPDVGRLTIETANAELDEQYGRSHIAVKPGPYVMISVNDTGVGMTPEVRERIFEPFFTTKEQGKGTGLGLSTVYGIVKQSGGNIWVYSERGLGTTFKIYFPRVDDPLTEVEREFMGEIPRGKEVILLVEDDREVRRLTAEILSRQGYRVLEAANGGEALLISEQHEGPIHLMLTDVIMPVMTGWQLAKRLSSSYPDMRVLYMSGYSDDCVVRNGILEKGLDFIQKPFTMDGLSRKVRAVLDKELRTSDPGFFENFAGPDKPKD